MSRYGDDHNAYEKEDLFDHIKNFLVFDNHPLSELMAILTDVVEYVEWKKAQDE